MAKLPPTGLDKSLNRDTNGGGLPGPPLFSFHEVLKMSIDSLSPKEQIENDSTTAFGQLRGTKWSSSGDKSEPSESRLPPWASALVASSLYRVQEKRTVGER
jgi:hypothetical protein